MSRSSEKFDIDRRDSIAKFPFLVLTVSILFTIGISYGFYQSSKNKDSIRFNNEVNRLQTTIENKINLYVALLKGGRGFIESNPIITRTNFAEYIESLNLRKNHSGMQGIGFAKTVSFAELAALQGKMNSEGIADFQVFPASEKNSYQVILYFEPLDERGRKMIGFDLSSEAKRMETLEKARDSGDVVTSPKVNPIEKDGDLDDTHSGFLICLPIYKNGEIPASVEERRQNISGFIYSPFRSVDFLNEVQKNDFSNDILLKIYDGEPTEENLLARTVNWQNDTFQNQISEKYSTRKETVLAGRKWIVEYSSLPTFNAQSSLGWTPLIFIIGSVFSFVLFGMTYWEASARLKLQSTAAELFELEQQKQGLLEKEQAARLSAEQAIKTKDEFIAIVSHELRTPLNAIAGWSRILQTEELSDNTKNLALEKIEKNLRLQTILIEDLINFSQIISGTIKLDKKEIAFSELFQDSVAEIEPSAREKKIEIIKDNQLNGQIVLGDKEKLKMVISNLLQNAVKFTPSGGYIKTVLKQSDENIQMIIKDNGKGISEQFLPHIFDRFTQADASSTRTFGGLGLGLTISYHIIKMHDGKIEADSAGIDKGATFTVTVPHFDQSE